MDISQDFRFLSAMLTLPYSDGTYPPDIAAYLRQISISHRVVLFSFPPKCGGTFLRYAAIQAIGGQLVRGSYAQGGGEAQFYLPAFLQYYIVDNVKNMVMHVHMQARMGNRSFMDAFDLKPVTMIRSIPDMLVSLRDMFCNEAGMMEENVCCEVPPNFPQMTEAAQAEFLLDLVAPWYATYYASWIRYASEEEKRVLLLRYNDLRAHPVDALQEVLDHSGHECSYDTCQAAILSAWNNRSKNRFNKGVPGRGRAFFSPEQLDKMQKILSQYPVLDAYQDELL